MVFMSSPNLLCIASLCLEWIGNTFLDLNTAQLVQNSGGDDCIPSDLDCSTEGVRENGVLSVGSVSIWT